jgi:hypothetical protein
MKQEERISSILSVALQCKWQSQYFLLQVPFIFKEEL